MPTARRAALLALALLAGPASAQVAPPARPPLVVFDGTGQPGSPFLPLPKLRVDGRVYNQASYRAFEASARRPTTAPADAAAQGSDDGRAAQARDEALLHFEEGRVRWFAHACARDRATPFCMDVEEFDLDALRADPARLADAQRKVAEAVGWFRAEAPGVRLFLYGGFPERDYYAAIERGIALALAARGDAKAPAWDAEHRPAFDRWQARNRFHEGAPFDEVAGRVADAPAGAPGAALPHGQGLADLFDAVCPSLYLFYPSEKIERGAAADQPVHDLALQLYYVQENVRQARRYGKPVYPFVWARLHASGGPVPLRQWFAHVREVARHADGMVLWDDDAKREPWELMRHRLAVECAKRFGAITAAEAHALLAREFGDQPELADLLAFDDPAP